MSVRRLLLLRHAKSSWDDSHLADHDRPLSSRGRSALTAVRQHLEAGGTIPGLVLCSSAVRTVATLEGIRGALLSVTTVEVGPDLYGADVDDLLARVRRVPDAIRCVMLIGHNPGMEDLALMLTGDGDPAARSAMESKFPTAAMAHLRVHGEWSDLQPGVAFLEQFWTPR